MGFGCGWSGGPIIKLFCQDLIGQMRPILHQQQPFYKTPWGHCLGQCVPWKQKGLAPKDPKIGELAAVSWDVPPARSRYHGSSFFCWKICRKLHLPLGQEHPKVCLNEFSSKFSFCLDVGFLTDLQQDFGETQLWEVMLFHIIFFLVWAILPFSWIQMDPKFKLFFWTNNFLSARKQT